MARVVLPFLCATFLPANSPAQSNMDAGRRTSWSANTGWMQWQNAGARQGGVTVGRTYLAGWIWAENVGWIHLGAGVVPPATGYANNGADDFGVNLDSGTGFLSGQAWGENIGWIRFDPTLPEESRPRIRNACGGCAWEFDGYGWAENVGWIDLEGAAAWRPAIINMIRRPDGAITFEWIGTSAGSTAVIEYAPRPTSGSWAVVSPPLDGATWTLRPSSLPDRGFFRVRLN